TIFEHLRFSKCRLSSRSNSACVSTTNVLNCKTKHLTSKGVLVMDQTVRLDDLPDVLYVPELAKLLRTTDKALRHKINGGHIKAVKIGGRILVTKPEVLRLLGLEPQPKRTTATIH